MRRLCSVTRTHLKRYASPVCLGISWIPCIAVSGAGQWWPAAESLHGAGGESNNAGRRESSASLTECTCGQDIACASRPAGCRRRWHWLPARAAGRMLYVCRWQAPAEGRPGKQWAGAGRLAGRQPGGEPPCTHRAPFARAQGLTERSPNTATIDIVVR